jgi:hypothetical protein
MSRVESEGCIEAVRTATSAVCGKLHDRAAGSAGAIDGFGDEGRAYTTAPKGAMNPDPFELSARRAHARQSGNDRQLEATDYTAVAYSDEHHVPLPGPNPRERPCVAAIHRLLNELAVAAELIVR